MSPDFNVIPQAANWLNVAGMVFSVSLLISYLVLPVKQTSRHYLTVGVVVAICLMQVCLQINHTHGRRLTKLAWIHNTPWR